MLAVERLSKRFGGFLAVNQVSFEVREGEILGLIGPNGSGKSTTFNLIAGTLRPTAGSIRLQGAEIASLAAHTIRRRGVGRTFQIPRPFRKLSLIENVALAAYYGTGVISRTQAWRQAEEVLDLVGLPSNPSATPSGLGPAFSRSSNSRARLPAGLNSCSPTKVLAGSMQRKWNAQQVCSKAFAAAWALRLSGLNTSWAC